MPELDLLGCRAQPLMSYLKALGAFRHASVADSGARLWWSRAGHARLRTRVDLAALLAFFIDDYEPTPITSPWNGGSGYFAGDNDHALRAIETSTDPRLTRLRETVAAARGLVAELNLSKAPEGEAKATFMRSWRALAPEGALDWLDAAAVLTDAGTSMNPLLGTGGNDGRLEFSNNFLGRLTECLPHACGIESTPDATDASRALLAYALTAEGEPILGRTKVGMFAPALSGMPNSWSVSQDATNASLLNPWDFVLMLEGAALFGGSVARSLSEQQAIFPFTTTAAGVDRAGRSMAGESARGETWLPLWGAPVSLPALRRLVSEGRVQDGRSQARSGRAMGRATSTLGVERGIHSFERVVYAGRFGRNYVAVPIDRVKVRASQQVELLRETDDWLRRARALGGNDIRACAAAVDRSAYGTALGEAGAFERWLVAMGSLELAVARTAAADSDTKVSPLQGLSARVTRELESGPEVRLATSLARVLAEPGARGGGAPAIRAALEPVQRQASGRVGWFGRGGAGAAGLHAPLDLLMAVARDASPAHETGTASIADVDDFLNGTLDEDRIVRLGFALSLCTWGVSARGDGRSPHPRGLDRVYAACYLAVRAGRFGPEGTTAGSRLTPQLVPALAAGAAQRAVRLAATRLRADGFRPLASLAECQRTPKASKRIAAALAFPLAPGQRAALEAAALMPPETVEGVAT